MLQQCVLLAEPTAAPRTPPRSAGRSATQRNRAAMAGRVVPLVFDYADAVGHGCWGSVNRDRIVCRSGAQPPPSRCRPSRQYLFGRSALASSNRRQDSRLPTVIMGLLPSNHLDASILSVGADPKLRVLKPKKRRVTSSLQTIENVATLAVTGRKPLVPSSRSPRNSRPVTCEQLSMLRKILACGATFMIANKGTNPAIPF